MKKQFKNQIFKSVLLLFSVIALLVGTVTVALAAITETRLLTLTFDENVEKCTVKIENSATGEWELYETVTQSGTVDIPYNAKVLLTVVPNTGKWPLITLEGGSIAVPQGNTVQWSAYKEDASVSVTCEERVYTIHALNYNREDETPYYTVVDGSVWSIAQLTGGVVTYQYGAEPLTELPAVKMEDYIFQGWNIQMGEGTDDVTPIKQSGDGKYYIPKDLTRTKYFDNKGGKIYVYPEMVPVQYPVYREDWVYDSNSSGNLGEKLFNAVGQQAPVKHNLSAIEKNFWLDDPTDSFKEYKGYLLMSDYSYSNHFVAEPPQDNLHYNTVYRFYTPILYTLVYLDNDGTDLLQKGYTPDHLQYTYSNKTVINQPTRRGYDFIGWKIEVYNKTTGRWEVANALTEVDFTFGAQKADYDETTRNDPNAIYASDAQADGKYEIRLTAQWGAKTYDITYDWNVTEPALKAELDALNASLPKSFVFDAEDLAINDPTRHGYKFLGWVLHYTNGEGQPATEELTSTDGKYLLNCNTYAQSITLTARWEAETYTVTLDGQGADNTFTTAIPGVQYDAVWTIPEGFQVPTRVGYTFKGYRSAPNGGGEQYIDKDGNVVDKKQKWDLDGENGSVTLYAEWEINKYSITIDTIEKIPAGKEQELSIEIYVNNLPILYKGEPILLDYQTVFYVKIGMPFGFEIVSWNVESFTKNDNVFTTGNITLGAENITMTIQARPSAPVLGGDVKSIRPISDTEIKVLFADATIATLYEVAISLDSDVANLAADAWKSIADGQDHYVFGDLQPGTHYYVFVRLKETADALSGIALSEKKLTEYDEYVEEMVDRLNGMITNGDGDIAKGVIANTIKEIDKLREDPDAIPENFYQLVQDLIDGVEEKLLFARLQDSKIAALQNHREECMASGSFSPENKALLNSLCADAVAEISGATTEEDVDAIYNTAKAAMQAVPVTHLYDANGFMQLTSQLGLAQNSGITLSSIEDIKALRRAIADAIAKGNITADSFITIEEATKLLRALDTVSAYSFNLINVQAGAGDVFTLRLTIPESLAGCTGLQVAYFNQATGMLELLETTIEGNTLVFKAKQIADFVILADPTVDLTAVIIALGAILLCQLIAIVLVLVSRNKAKNSVMHASVALPLFLTIHFLPVANAELIALGLGIAVILAQIVLMWLLISSGMIRVFKTKKTAPAQQEVTAVVREEDLQEDPYAAFDEEASDEETVAEEAVDEEVPEEEVTEEAPAKEMLDDDAFDEELAEELAREQEEEFPDGEQVVEEELHEETEEVYDDEEFIEHAPNPYYSLDEEENVYAFDEEETERVSDVDTTDQEAEETSFGDDPLDGVFGGADVQDGDARDEGERSFDEDSYTESYEYGDEADAPYAETEDAYREETSGEGSIDATAYIVNDEEDLSDEEEMYRYDE